MQFRVLGTLQIVDDDGGTVELGGAQPRLVVAALLASAGRAVTTETLVDAVWGEEPPASATGTLQSYVSRLRQSLEPDRGPRGAPRLLLREPTGYRLAVDPGDVDFLEFERLAEHGRALLAEGHAAAAREALVQADALWRGPAFAEHRDHEFARGLATRLEERRLAASEDRLEADLALGRHAALIGELTELVAAHPLRESLRGLLARALYRAGRQADALRALDDARRTLRDELGVEPSRPLRDLEAAILAHDPALDAPAPTLPDAPVADRRSPTAAAGSPSDGDAGATGPALDGGGLDHDGADDRLIGRAAEMAQLRAALSEASRGTRTVIVEGEPGIGKTRLAEELTAEAQRAGALVLWGRAFEGAASPAFWPWLPPLRALAGELADDETAPELAALLSSTPSAAATAAASLPDSARFSVVEAVAAILERVGANRTVIVVFDDLQWADPASLELLAALPARLHTARVLFVVTIRELEVGRNDDVVAALAALTRSTGSRRLALHGLSPEESRSLVARATGGDVDVVAADSVYGRAEGNPFYTTELARLLAGGHLDDVPSGVRDVVRRRVGQLPAATVELLQVASVIGRDVEINLLTAAAGRDLPAVLDALEPALLHRLVVSVPERPGWYRFAHALVREVVVDDLGPLQRARLHVQVADALGDDDDTAEILAEHLWAAVPIGVGRRAAAALERASHVAIARLAYRSAMDLLERAVQLQRSAGTSPDDPGAELRSLVVLIQVIGAHLGYAALVDSPHVPRAKALAAQHGSFVDRVTITWAEWAGLDVSCQFDRADPIARELLAIVEPTGDALGLALAHTCNGISAWHHGRIREAAFHLDAAVSYADEVPPGASLSSLFDLDQLRLSAPFSLYVHDLMGDLVDPDPAYERLLRGGEGAYWQLIVTSFEASAAMTTGDGERVVRAARLGLSSDPDQVAAFWSSQQRLYLAAGLMLVGDFEAGEPMFEESWAYYETLGQRTNSASFHAARAIAHGLRGHVEPTTAAAAAARSELERFGERHAEPNVLLAEAIVAQLRGDVEAATALAVRGAELATEQGSMAVAERVRRDAARAGIPIDAQPATAADRRS